MFQAANPQITLLHCVDDLLLAASSKELCLEGTKRLLTELGELGYRASAKAQICTQQPLTDAEATWFSDGNSFLERGRQRAGAAIVDGK